MTDHDIQSFLSTAHYPLPTPIPTQVSQILELGLAHWHRGPLSATLSLEAQQQSHGGVWCYGVLWYQAIWRGDLCMREVGFPFSGNTPKEFFIMYFIIAANRIPKRHLLLLATCGLFPLPPPRFLAEGPRHVFTWTKSNFVSTCASMGFVKWISRVRKIRKKLFFLVLFQTFFLWCPSLMPPSTN